jgi:molybdate transport system substrate-binding protein
VSRRLALAAAAVVLGGLAGCGAEGSEGTTTLTVFAASSLTEPFEQIGDAFADEHDGVQVVFSFGGSSDLATQIRGGAPADVFASADVATMAGVDEGGLTAPSRRFATNTLTIAVPAGNPAGVERFDDLEDPGLDVVVCAPQVPCGAATARVQDAAGVDLRPVSEERNVTDVLSKVATGEADAGLVYVTDFARAGGDVDEVGIPEAKDVVNAYPIAVVEDTAHPGLAREFVDFVLSPAGQDVLADAGFGSQ